MKHSEVQTLLQVVFGSDSDEVDGDLAISPVPITGFFHCRQYVDLATQDALLEAIAKEGWFEEPGMNQAMRFGKLPHWASELAAKLPVHLFGHEICSRMPLFDQLIVNRYQPGEGITPHIDLARFEDGIAIVSLGSAAVMQFTLDGLIEPVLLSPGDVLLLCSDARFKWKHGIAAVMREEHEGVDIERGCRTSITMRKLWAAQ